MKHLAFKITNIRWDRCRKKGFDRSSLPKEVFIDLKEKGLSDFTFISLDEDQLGISLNHWLCTMYGPKNNYFEFEKLWIED